MNWRGRIVAAFMAVLPTPAAASCQLAKYFDLPVMMTGRNPVVSAEINGREARFILDSGAFFSTISRAGALEYGLVVRGLGGAQLRGIGGSTSLSVATARTFTIAGHAIPNVEFAVGGSDFGVTGLLGQNVLGIGDVEYDLPHGVIHLWKSLGCGTITKAYWAGSKPFAMIPLEGMGPGQRHTIGTIAINGIRLKALFDSGVGRTLLTMAAARRLGLRPGDPGVEPVGYASGVGEGRARTWQAKVETIDLGGEAIRRPTVEFGEVEFPDADLLIGIDFFLTHHLYVDNQNRRLFVTYEGGPVFGLNPKGAVDQAGKALDLTDRAGEPTDAAGFARRAAVLVAAHKLEPALADYDRAVALAPGDARMLVQRAVVHLENVQPLLAAADLDAAITLAPGDAEARLVRARLRLGAHDPAGALTDLVAADKALPPTSDARLRLAGLYDVADTPEPAIGSYDLWLKAHPEDQGRAAAFNGRCWARALLARDLDKALGDCNEALRLRPKEPAFLDSRALVRLRRGDLERALADYDAALAVAPKQAWSLYVRGIVERRRGDAAKADADRSAALAIDPKVAERAKRYGLD